MDFEDLTRQQRQKVTSPAGFLHQDPQDKAHLFSFASGVGISEVTPVILRCLPSRSPLLLHQQHCCVVYFCLSCFVIGSNVPAWTSPQNPSRDLFKSCLCVTTSKEPTNIGQVLFDSITRLHTDFADHQTCKAATDRVYIKCLNLGLSTRRN